MYEFALPRRLPGSLRSRASRRPPPPSIRTLEALNFAKTAERMQYVTLTPEFQARLIEANLQNLADMATITAGDPERVFITNVCAQKGNECAGDVRFYDWAEAGFGTVEPVLFTARNGSTISGRVWAAATGPAKRPLVVITTGSVQAPEQLYWGQAATLAKHGYVVLTYDVQGQGRSDTFGDGVDRFDGVPSQEGRPFYDNTEDALDFALSKPGDPYDPRPSCTSGHRPLGEAGPARRRGAATPPTTRSGTSSTPTGLGSRATRWAPPPSRTSARSTTASTRSPPGTTCGRPRPILRRAPAARRRGLQARRSPSPRSASRTTTASRRRR